MGQEHVPQWQLGKWKQRLKPAFCPSCSSICLRFVLFSLVGFKRNSSLLESCCFFPGALTNWKCFILSHPHLVFFWGGPCLVFSHVGAAAAAVKGRAAPAALPEAAAGPSELPATEPPTQASNCSLSSVSSISH